MVKINQSSKTQGVSINKIVICLALVTLYFNTQSTDPFNSPKLWVLMLCASLLLGELFIFRKTIFSVLKSNLTFGFSIAFIISLFVALIFSDQKYIAFFGEYMRRNGFLQYLCLWIIFVYTALKVNKSHSRQIYNLAMFLGLILSFYGVLQHFGRDFVGWNNPYNPVILTVGNPNFASALMAIILILNFSAFLNVSINSIKRVIHFGLVLLNLLVIIYSNSRQGLIASALGIIIFLLVLVYKKSAKLGGFFTVITIVLFVTVVLGMLQKGPLTSLLYKGSVSVRGYYWRAAIEMFKDHPLFGVGLDSYGLFFKEYREPAYSLSYGFSITSSNAHNTFLQFFATGGALVGILYLLFMTLVFVTSIRKIKYCKDNELIFFLGLFSAWLAFQAQSLISIDNIGISVWNWVLSGFLVGLSSELDFVNESKNKVLSQVSSAKALVISWLLFILTFVLVSLLYQGENRFLKLRDGKIPGLSENKQVLIESIDEINNSKFTDTYYKLVSLTRLDGNEYAKKIENDILVLENSNPRDLDVLASIANLYQNLGDRNKEIIYRNKIAEIDPWNAENLLALGIAYRNNLQQDEMQSTLEALLKFVGNHPISTEAKKELKF